MAVIKPLLIRGVVGIIAGAIIGVVLAVLLTLAAPDQWIDTWTTETGLEEHHIARLLCASIATIITFLSLTLGSVNLGRQASLLAWGILCGCFAATALTLGAAWFDNEWPFRVKTPQTTIGFGRCYLLPAGAVIGGFSGMYIAARRSRRHKRQKNHTMHPGSGGRSALENRSPSVQG
jgi:ABC-type Fe3+-siderophore transport system permease subunit